MVSIELIDDFFTDEEYLRLLSFTDSCPMYPCALSNPKTDPHGHWVTILSNTDRFNKEDAADKLPSDMKFAWEKIRQIIKHKTLVTSYMNGYTYGTDGYFHRDWHEEGHTTVIVYLLRDDWDPDWAGETVFIDDDKNIRASIFPKANRVVVFPSNVNHCARGVSRKFNGIRKTLMFKTRLEINTKE